MSNFLTDTVIGLVENANPGRHPSNLNRRMHKWFEEFGELSQTWLSVSSLNNHRALQMAALREEACDVLIVAIDLALTKITRNFALSSLAESLALFATTRPNISALTPSDEYDALAMHAAAAACGYATSYHYDPPNADFIYGHAMVRYCFGIVDFAFSEIAQGENRDSMIIFLITQKLAKWADNRATGRVATDAE